jgi:hypothetical protein
MKTSPKGLVFINLNTNEETMEECSFKAINNEPCHRSIKEGSCPGLASGACVNITAIQSLQLRYESESRLVYHRERAKSRELRSAFPCHFVDQNDTLRVGELDTKKTLRSLSNLMQRVKRLAFRKGTTVLTEV